MAGQIFAVFSDDGKTAAFYREGLHADIPTSAVPIDEPTWQAFISGGKRWNGSGLEDIPPEPPPVPERCTKLGLVRALKEQGTWASIKVVIASDAEAQEEWDLATELRRADPIVQRMIVAAGLSEAQVDALLVRANELV